MSNIIHCKALLRCSTPKAFRFFTQNEEIVTWLNEKAEIEACLGGKYELFWDKDGRENNSTLGCNITAFEPNKLVAFTWKGPVQFANTMNSANPLTHVCVTFFPINEQETEVHLVHSGWGNSEVWEEARLWFEHVWSASFLDLEQICRHC